MLQESRAVEFLKCLKEDDAQVPEGLDVHIVMDDYATHKTKHGSRRPRWHAHFTPTSASWINQVERWFAELNRKQIQRGCSYLRMAARDRHPYLRRPAQQKPEVLQMDQVRRPDIGFRQTVLPQSPVDFMWRTLDSRD